MATGNREDTLDSGFIEVNGKPLSQSQEKLPKIKTRCKVTTNILSSKKGQNIYAIAEKPSMIPILKNRILKPITKTPFERKHGENKMQTEEIKDEIAKKQGKRTDNKEKQMLAHEEDFKGLKEQIALLTQKATENEKHMTEIKQMSVNVLAEMNVINDKIDKLDQSTDDKIDGIAKLVKQQDQERKKYAEQRSTTGSYAGKQKRQAAKTSSKGEWANKF
ncbi:uncharacterized protein LOC132737184 [Ruditapes philippinarum]|uniref:uncharacterized protein LOC132737184 n=1 Tax=Ruditapes philippinarum TaxID=129788 RepID=UPI00295ACD6F|nr:uncharacterized protein LOC132737184 [Ruditapes philippinarum]